MKVQISVDFVVSVRDGIDANSLGTSLDYQNVSIETVSGELVDAEFLEHTTHDPRLDYSSLPTEAKLRVE
jgi:hypothetical protein